MKSGLRFLKDELIAIYVEVEFQPFYKNQPLFGDIDCFLRKQSYTIAALNRTHLRRSDYIPDIYSRRELVWGHVLYLRSLESIYSHANAIDMIGRATALYASFDLFDLSIELMSTPSVIDIIGENKCREYINEIYTYASNRTEFIRNELRKNKFPWASQLCLHTSTDKSKPFWV
jgi:hypothetical protein